MPKLTKARIFAKRHLANIRAKLSKLLRAVALGQRYTITVRGKTVADLVPSETAAHYDVHAAVASMRAFKRIQGIAAADISKMIAEGRR